jgi:hypothetical protein
MPSEDSGKKHFQLTQTQRKKLRGEEELGDAPGRFLRDIREKKVEQLGKRFEILFDDIHAMAAAGYFEEDFSGSVWDRVQTDDDEWKSWEWEPILEEILCDPDGHKRRPQEPHRESPAEFAIELGHHLRLLCTDDFKNESIIRMQLYLMIGMFIEPFEQRSNKLVHRPTKIFALIDEIRKNAEEWVFEEMRVASESSFHDQRRFDIIKSVFAEHALTPSIVLSAKIIADTGFIPTPQSDDAEFAPDMDEEELTEFVTELIEETEIREMEELINKMDICIYQFEEISTYINKSISAEQFQGGQEYADTIEGVDSDDNLKALFRICYSKQGTVTSADFPNDVSNKCVHHLKQFAGQKDNSYVWEQHPVLTQNETGWCLTAFGELLGYHMFEREYPQPFESQYQDSPERFGWLHRYVIKINNSANLDKISVVPDSLKLTDYEESIIKDALEEVGITVDAN